MKKFIPRRYVLLYLCENYIFLAFICYIDHFINQKYQKILPTEFDQVTLFLLFQKRHWIHERPCCTICTITLEPFVVETRTRPKEEWWHFLNPLSLWEFLLARQVVVRLKTPFSWIAENFWKFLEKKIRLRQNFIFFHAV